VLLGSSELVGTLRHKIDSSIDGLAKSEKDFASVLVGLHFQLLIESQGCTFFQPAPTVRTAQDFKRS